MGIKLSQVVQNLIRDPELSPEQKKQEIDDLLANAHTIPEIEDDRINHVGMGVGGEASTAREPGTVESGVRGVGGALGRVATGAGKEVAKILMGLGKRQLPMKIDSKGNFIENPEKTIAETAINDLQSEGIAENLGSFATDMVASSPFGKVGALVKGAGTVPAVLRAALTGASETAGLNALKGQETTENDVLMSGGLSGSLGLTGRAVQGASKGYLRHLLKTGNDQARPPVIKATLDKVLETNPVDTLSNPTTVKDKLQVILDNLRGPTPKPLSTVFDTIKEESNTLGRNAIPLAVTKTTLKDKIRRGANKGLLGAYDPALTSGVPSGTAINTLKNASENDFKALDPNFKKSGKAFIKRVEDILSKNDPKITETAPTFKDPVGSIKREYVDPRTNRKIPTGLVNPNLVDNSSLVSLLTGLEDNIPNALRTPRSDPKNDFIEFLRNTLTENNPELGTVLAKRAAKEQGLLALQGLINKAKVGGNDAVGAGKVVSGFTAGKLPYTAAAAASIANPANAARHTYAMTKQFENTILPQLLKAIAAGTASKPFQGQQ